LPKVVLRGYGINHPFLVSDANVEQMTTSRTLLTIGYEGSTIDEFITTLTSLGVTHLADVRDVPISRKKGFSKRLLSERLASVDIAYSHFKPLGDPKNGREAARRGETDEFRRIYSKVLSSDEAKRSILELGELTRKDRVCLLCYERLPKDCHRAMIAQELRDSFGTEVYHVGVRNGSFATGVYRRSTGFSESMAARWV
jgi:uncharacterized protein (DUF488 family)